MRVPVTVDCKPRHLGITTGSCHRQLHAAATSMDRYLNAAKQTTQPAKDETTHPQQPEQRALPLGLLHHEAMMPAPGSG
jgi:hypothetical protein